MSQISRFFRTLPQDPLRAVMVLLMSGTVIFLLLMPLSSSVARLSMERFHLRSPSFLGWASMQIVPSMYNFENHYWLGGGAVDVDEEGAPSKKRWAINHFPARIMTYGFFRKTFASIEDSTIITLRSRYQGTEVVTSYQLRRADDGTMVFQRVDAP